MINLMMNFAQTCAMPKHNMLRRNMLQQSHAQALTCSSVNVATRQCKSNAYRVHAHGLLDHTAQVSQLGQVSVVWGSGVGVGGSGQQAMGIQLSCNLLLNLHEIFPTDANKRMLKCDRARMEGKWQGQEAPRQEALAGCTGHDKGAGGWKRDSIVRVESVFNTGCRYKQHCSAVLYSSSS